MIKVNPDTPQFAYFVGYFCADGSLYNSCGRSKFEFSDGTSIKEELIYSYEFLQNIRKLLKQEMEIDTPNLFRKENKYILKFGNKKLKEVFRTKFGIMPGPKTYSITLPKRYKNNKLEKFFWLGMMDGDGMIARNSRKIALGLSNQKLIKRFKNFLKNNDINFKYYKRDHPGGYCTNKPAYTIAVCAASFNKFASQIGFLHPRKRLWIKKHLKNKNCFIENNIIFTNQKNILDYKKIFDYDNVFIVDGKFLLEKFSLKTKRGNNKKFKEIFKKLKEKGFSDKKIFKILSNYRWKLSKGSKNSIKMPLTLNSELLEIAKFIRFRSGSVTLSKKYIESFNKNPNKVIKSFESIFGIKAKYTCKKEPLFCSGILNMFFTYFVKRNKKEYKLPNWKII